MGYLPAVNRRDFLETAVVSLVVAALGGRPARAASSAKEPTMQPFRALFEKSMTEKKGLTLWVRGQQIGLVVTKIGDGVVEGRNRELSTIVVRTDSIDAAGLA